MSALHCMHTHNRIQNREKGSAQQQSTVRMNHFVVRWQNSRYCVHFSHSKLNISCHAGPVQCVLRRRQRANMKHLSSFIIRTHKLFIKIVQHTNDVTKEKENKVLITWRRELVRLSRGHINMFQERDNTTTATKKCSPNLCLRGKEACFRLNV